MQIELTEVEDCKRKLKIGIPAERVSTEFNSAIKKVSAAARIKGFRQGKAPRKLVELHYKEAIESEVLKNIVPKACEEAISEKKLEIIGQYAVEECALTEGEPLNIIITAEVKPELNLQNYKDIKVEKKEVKIEESEVDETIEKLRIDHAELKSAGDREAREGDEIIFDFKWEMEGKDLPEPVKEAKATLGKGELLPELEKEMLGMKPGENKDITITYPETHGQKDFAGKKALFRISVKELKEKILPAIDDEFAKDVGNGNTMAELKDDIRKRLLKAKEEIALRDSKQELITKLIEQNPFTPPKSLVEQETEMMVHNWEENLKQRGESISHLNKEEVIKFINEIRSEAERAVKTRFIIEKLSSLEVIKIEDADVDQEIKKHADLYKKDPQQIRGIYEKNGVLEYLKDRLLEEKVLNFLLGYSNI
ncbi:MAG: trigger factor [Candidatus Schekmanbacteria bacterium]|nr:trigger factor [Candidatus Schekmanbacteria bacterium]